MIGIGHFARNTPDATALAAMGSSVTFAGLDRRHRALAGWFEAAGLGHGDRIAVLSANRVEYLELTTGALRAGVIPVPIHGLLSDPEAAYVLEDSGANWLFTDRAIGHLPPSVRVITFGDAYERCLFEAEPADTADVMLTRPLHYTSGSTGRPKGVWVPPCPEPEAVRLAASFRDEWRLTTTDVHLVCSPLSHSAPHRYASRTLEAGGAVVVLPHFDAVETLAAIDLFDVTSTFVVPTHLERIFSLEERMLGRFDVSSLRLVAHAGAPIRPETKKNAIGYFPDGSVWEFYGSTEGQGPRISSEEWLSKPGSVGRARRGAALYIRDERGEPLPAGEVGRVWIQDPQVERFEYWRDRPSTDAAWDDGAFTVGDLGRLDADGYLYLVGRANDMIITGGINVYPQEVEDVLASHPSVAEVVVVGAPSDEWGQEVQAYVVPALNQPLDTDRLRTWARERLAGYKCPRRIKVVEELPRTPTGKLRRRRPDP